MRITQVPFASSPVKSAALYIFDIFNRASPGWICYAVPCGEFNWAGHGGKRHVMFPGRQLMAENDNSWETSAREKRRRPLYFYIWTQNYWLRKSRNDKNS